MAVSTHSRFRPTVPLLRGGTDGNAQLTAMTGVTLIVLLAVLGVTILRIRQLIWVHLFVGLLLLAPVALKLASTGYRFLRYYTHNRAYRAKGPPPLLMRLIAPMVVLSTLIVFVSGVILLITGPSDRGQMVTIHKASFIIWLAFTTAHVLGHLPGLGRTLRGSAAGVGLSTTPGASGRWIVLTGALVGGVVLAIALIPSFSAWTHGAFVHHHELH